LAFVEIYGFTYVLFGATFISYRKKLGKFALGTGISNVIIGAMIMSVLLVFIALITGIVSSTFEALFLMRCKTDDPRKETPGNGENGLKALADK